MMDVLAGDDIFDTTWRLCKASLLPDDNVAADTVERLLLSLVATSLVAEASTSRCIDRDSYKRDISGKYELPKLPLHGP